MILLMFVSHLMFSVTIVEKIVNKRSRNEWIEYLIKWQGYSIKENTWEPEKNLRCK